MKKLFTSMTGWWHRFSTGCITASHLQVAPHVRVPPIPLWESVLPSHAMPAGRFRRPIHAAHARGSPWGQSHGTSALSRGLPLNRAAHHRRLGAPIPKAESVALFRQVSLFGYHSSRQGNGATCRPNGHLDRPTACSRACRARLPECHTRAGEHTRQRHHEPCFQHGSSSMTSCAQSEEHTRPGSAHPRGGDNCGNPQTKLECWDVGVLAAHISN